MKFLSNIFEAKNDIIVMKPEELKQYVEKVGKKLPQDIKFILDYCIKYNILSNVQLDSFIESKGSGLKRLSNEFGMTEEEVNDLYKLLNGAKKMKNLLPQYQSEKIRKAFLDGVRNIEDMSLDLETEKGREAAVKQYMPLINKIVHQYEGKSSLSHSELMSAALEGFALAMQDYNAPDDYVAGDSQSAEKNEIKKQKKNTFKSYAAHRIAWKILDDMNNLSRVVRMYKDDIYRNAKENPSANFNSVSIDTLLSSDPDSASKADRMKELSVGMQAVHTPDEEKQWQKVFAIIDQKFNVKSTAIFYKAFGLNGYKKQQPVEIAKELGVSKANISQIIKRITTFLASDPKTLTILQDLQDMYTESLVVANFNKNVSMLEVFVSDDIYMLLEDVNKWSNPAVLKNSINNVLSEYDVSSRNFIMNCIQKGFGYLDNNYRSNKKLIVHFLEGMYPTEILTKKSDVYILQLMEEIITAVQTNKIKL